MTSCPCCNRSDGSEIFRSTIRKRYVASYLECPACRSLWIPSSCFMHWIVEAYKDPAEGDRADGGAAWRNAEVAKVVRAFAPARVLDFGSGQGLLAKELARSEIPTHNTDLMRGIDERSGEGYPLIACIEVLEHVPGPQDLLTALGLWLQPRGVILASTCLRKPWDGPEWSYLATDYGQHLLLLSADGLDAVVKTTGFVWHATLVHTGQPELQIHVLSREPVMAVVEVEGFQWVRRSIS